MRSRKFHPTQPTIPCMIPGDTLNLSDILAANAGREGVIWALQDSSDLNANLVHFPAGKGVGEHVNNEVDVLLIGISGSGTVNVDGEVHAVHFGTVTLIPKGVRRSTSSTSENFTYLTVHRRRGPLQIGN